MAMDGEELRKTMRLWASGVTVVTAARDDRRAGVTVSSFTSVSLEPPLILVCLQRGIATFELIQESGVFGVALLRVDQQWMSTQFAGYTELPPGEDRFYNVPVTTAVTGAPLLAKALAWMDCRVYGIHDGGTSCIVVGEVLATARHTDEAPLLYHKRAYHRALPLE